MLITIDCDHKMTGNGNVTNDSDGICDGILSNMKVIAPVTVILSLKVV